MTTQLSVVVPVRNEEPNVAPLTGELLAALRGYPGQYELILVDDASTDNTWAQLLAAQRAEPRIRPIRHLQPGGQSAALWTGFQASRGQIIATMDGDLQDDPAELPRFLAEVANCDLVCGVRSKRMDSGVRRISSKVARFARRTALGVDFRDTGCNYRAFRRSVLEKLPAFNGFHRFMPILVQGTGATVRELPITHRPRVAGLSKYGVWNRLGRGIADLVMVALFRRRQLKNIPCMESSLPAEPRLTTAGSAPKAP